MTLTIFDPITGKHVTITRPEKPPSVLSRLVLELGEVAPGGTRLPGQAASTTGWSLTGMASEGQSSTFLIRI